MWSLGITCVELGKIFLTGGNIFRIVVFVLSKVQVVQKLRNAETVHPYSIQQSYKVYLNKNYLNVLVSSI